MDILTFKKEVVKVEKISFNQYLINEFKEYLKGESFTRDLKQIYNYMQAFYNLDFKETKKQYIYLWNCYLEDNEVFKNEVEKIKQFVKNRNK